MKIEQLTLDMERNANEYSELFYHCVQVLNEYDKQISEEIFLEEYFQANKVFLTAKFLSKMMELIVLGS